MPYEYSKTPKKQPIPYKKAIPLGDDKGVVRTLSLNRKSDKLFKQLQKCPLFKNHSVKEKKALWRDIFYSAVKAHYRKKALRFSLRQKGKNNDARDQLIQCAVQLGFFSLIKASRWYSVETIENTNHQSRLILGKIWEEILPKKESSIIKKEPVVVKEIEEGLDMTPAEEIKMKVEVVNAVIEASNITYRKKKKSTKTLPMDFYYQSSFIANWALGGRLYTKGATPLNEVPSKLRTSVIRIDGEPVVELDYGSFQPRALYNFFENMESPEDPYAVFTENTPSHRELAKMVFLRMINSDKRISKKWGIPGFLSDLKSSVVRSCQRAANKNKPGAKNVIHVTSKKTGKLIRKTVRPEIPKEGKSLERALTIQKHLFLTGLTFEGVFDIICHAHKDIVHWFGKGNLGLSLMKVESTIALNVMYHFASKGVVCLGVHDSFLVPEDYQKELRKVMVKEYQKVAKGWTPKIK